MYLSYMQQKTRLEPALRACNCSRIIFTPPNPWKGRVGSLRASHRVKRKKQSVWTASSFERKTRLELALRADNYRELIFTPPTPERGEWGRFVQVIVPNEKSSPFGLLLRLSGKRDSNSRFAWALSRELYLHPQPLKGATWGRFVRAIVCASTK